MGQKLEIQPDTIIVPPQIGNYAKQLAETLGHGNTTNILLDVGYWECSGWAAIPHNLFGSPVMFGGDRTCAYKYYAHGGGDGWSSERYDGSWEEMMEYYQCQIKVDGEWIY